MRSIRLSLLLVLGLVGCGGGGGGGGGSGGSLFSVANPYAVAGATSVDQVRVDNLRVFGDSYSIEGFGGTTTWSTLLRNDGTVAINRNFARSGARAASGNDIDFDRQIDNFEAQNATIGDRDLTVVYLGYNDLAAPSLAAAEAGYTVGMQRLLDVGAAQANRRLFVTLIHDWSRNPGVANVDTATVQSWNSFVRDFANENNRVIAVDLFTVFNRIYDQPGLIGLASATTVGSGASDTSALYVDPTHFNNLGQDVIARVYRHYLTRAWDWSNRLNAGSQTVTRLNQDITNGVLVLGLDADDTEPSLGFSSFAFGGARDAQVLASSFADERSAASAPTAVALRDPSRASFAEAYAPNPTSGGIALDYRPAANQRLGVAVARYETATDTLRPAASLVQDQSSDAVALYWQQAHAGVTATTQLAYLQHDYADRGFDADVGLQGTNRYTGSSWALEQQLARPWQAGGGTITPWASLGYQAHALEPYTARSLYTSDVRFSGARLPTHHRAPWRRG